MSVIIIMFVVFIFTSTTAVLTNCKLPRQSEVYDCIYEASDMNYISEF